MITEAQEAALAARRARISQDKKFPFLIHVEDGRLMPNVPALRGHKNYRVFTGSPKAGPDERKAWLRSMNGEPALPVDEVAFDIGKATAEEIVAFAAAEYGKQLDPKTHLSTLRSQVRKLAEEAGNLA